ncbi:MAG TPA: potassium channel family protein [Candidatus Bilamarchaeaceae archaeon]|nr:potassium channel family protein [Candidatus Bilamarchaeaceae archaeon]
MARQYGVQYGVSPMELPSNSHRKNITRNLLLAVASLLFMYLVSIYLFELYEGWSLLDSVYFVTATISTVGYGDVVPHSNEGKILTIVLIWTGISLAFYIIYQIALYREKMLDKHFHLGERLRIFRDLINIRARKR